jgi:hypothetical protein
MKIFSKLFFATVLLTNLFASTSSIAFADEEEYGDGYYTVVDMTNSTSNPSQKLACTLDRSYGSFKNIANGSFKLVASNKYSDFLGAPAFIKLVMNDGSNVVGAISYRIQSERADGTYLYYDNTPPASYWGFTCKNL